jgi:hypothetical protein
MKFATQHIKVSSGKNSYGLHRDNNVTWETVSGRDGTVTTRNMIAHTSVAKAKGLLGSFTSQKR